MFWLVGWFPELLSRAFGLFEPDSMVRSRERKAIHGISLAVSLVGFYLISSSFFPNEKTSSSLPSLNCLMVT